jgi:trimethylamine--corrinoid protein Co-methyltransferase
VLRRSNYLTNSSLSFRVFTEQQCEEIHSATLEVLEKVGVEMHHPKALEVLKKAGCYVDGERVKIPAALVERCIRNAPSRVVLCNREGESKMFLEGSRFYFGPGPTANYTIDPFTGERRHPGISDTCRASRVMDSLQNIDFQMDFGTARDVDDKKSDVYMFEAMLRNSTKPIVHWGFNSENYQTMVDMAAAVAGGLQELQNYPFLCFYSEPITPLQHDYHGLDKAMFMADNNLPCIYTPAPLAGTTAPATLAGTIVIGNAESLSGLVVSQLVREGAPFIMGGVITVMDMATTQITYSSPEFSLMAAGLTNMAQYYKIPMFSTAGCSDSKCVDQQNGIDITTNILMAALSGGNLIHDVGYIESGISTSLLQLVIADDVIGQVKRIVRGIEVNENTLALDVIKKVGPGGHFLAEQHTLENFRKETFFPNLFNRERFDSWTEKGQPELADIARNKLEVILKEYQQKELDKNADNKIKEIMASI